MDRLERLGVNTRLGKRLAEEQKGVTLADGVRQRDVVGRVDRQIQGEGAVAAIDGLQRFRVNTLFRERLAEEEEGVALADGVRQRDVVGRMDRQGQGEGAVAAIDRLQRLRVNALFREQLAEELEGVARTNHVRKRYGIRGVHHKLQHIDAVAARHDRDQGVIVGSRRAVTAVPPLEWQVVVTHDLQQGVAGDRVYLYHQHLDDLSASSPHGLGNGDGGSAVERLVVPKYRRFIITNGRVIVIDDRKMQRDYTVGAVYGMHQRVFATGAVECQTFPYQRQIGGVNGVVQIDVFVCINIDVNDSVEGTPVLVNQRESVSHRGVVRQILGRRDDEGGVTGARHPLPAQLIIRNVRVVCVGQVFRQRQLRFEDVAVVKRDAVDHFNVPQAVDRASCQVGERLIRMVELLSG